MHTGLEDRAGDTDRLAAVLRRTGARRRRPDHHRRVRAQPHRMAAAVRLADGVVVGGTSTPPHHRRRARRGRQDPAADTARGTLCLPTAFGERIGDQSADQSLQAARTEERRRHRPRLRAVRGAGPRRRLRRCRDHGQRRLSGQPVPRAPHEQADRRVGRIAGEAQAVSRRDRPPRPRSSRTGLHPLLPNVDGRLRRGRSELG